MVMKIIIEDEVLRAVSTIEKYNYPLPFEVKYYISVDNIDNLSSDESLLLSSLPSEVYNNVDQYDIKSIDNFLDEEIRIVNANEVTSIHAIRKLIYSYTLKCNLKGLITILKKYDIFIDIFDEKAIGTNNKNEKLYTDNKNEIRKNLYFMGEKECPKTRKRQEIMSLYPNIGFEKKSLKKTCGNCTIDYQYHFKYNSKSNARIYFDFVELFSSNSCNNELCKLIKICNSKCKILLVAGLEHE